MNSRAGRSLTPRQAEIAALLARGKSSREIAQALYLSPRTVDVHIAAIREKWKMRSRLELATTLLAGDTELGEDRTAGSSRGPTPPMPSASLIGREAEITVLGAGGLGKTRIALAVREALCDDAQADIWIVELAPIARVGPVSNAMAEASESQGSPGRPLIETLVADLKQKSLVLIIEN